MKQAGAGGAPAVPQSIVLPHSRSNGRPSAAATPGHEVAAAVVATSSEDRALHRDDGVEGVVDEGRPDAVEDAAAQRVLGDGPGVDA